MKQLVLLAGTFPQDQLAGRRVQSVQPVLALLGRLLTDQLPNLGPLRALLRCSPLGLLACLAATFASLCRRLTSWSCCFLSLSASSCCRAASTSGTVKTVARSAVESVPCTIVGHDRSLRTTGVRRDTKTSRLTSKTTRSAPCDSSSAGTLVSSSGHMPTAENADTRAAGVKALSAATLTHSTMSTQVKAAPHATHELRTGNRAFLPGHIFGARAQWTLGRVVEGDLIRKLTVGTSGQRPHQKHSATRLCRRRWRMEKLITWLAS